MFRVCQYCKIPQTYTQSSESCKIQIAHDTTWSIEKTRLTAMLKNDIVIQSQRDSEREHA